MRYHRRAILAGLAAAAIAPTSSGAAPQSKLYDVRWRRFRDRTDVDHRPLDAFLKRYRSLDGDGVARIAYGRVSAADRERLAAYVEALRQVAPSQLTKDAAYAYWVNLYNALTLKLVLDAYPVSSIKQVEGGLFNTGPWTETVATVEGLEISLDIIEHGVLRPVFDDPRTHYAVNCASIGCPNIDATAFQPTGLNERLDRLAKAYVNHRRGAWVEERRLRVSSIYVWFREDFGGSDAGVIAHLKQFAEPELKARLDGIAKIDDHAYDWALNEAT